MTAYHYRIAPVVTDPDGMVHPDVIGSFVWIRALGQHDRAANRCLVKVPVADGTALTADTVAVLGQDDDDVPETNLTLAQRTAWRTRLENAGFDVSAWDGDGVTDRRRLLRFVLRRVFGWSLTDLRTAIHGFTVAGDA